MFCSNYLSVVVIGGYSCSVCVDAALPVKHGLSSSDILMQLNEADAHLDGPLLLFAMMFHVVTVGYCHTPSTSEPVMA